MLWKGGPLTIIMEGETGFVDLRMLRSFGPETSETHLKSLVSSPSCKIYSRSKSRARNPLAVHSIIHCQLLH
jgi:hypothetical protein